jgi:hypothetical protein
MVRSAHIKYTHSPRITHELNGTQQSRTDFNEDNADTKDSPPSGHRLTPPARLDGMHVMQRANLLESYSIHEMRLRHMRKKKRTTCRTLTKKRREAERTYTEQRGIKPARLGAYSWTVHSWTVHSQTVHSQTVHSWTIHSRTG